MITDTRARQTQAKPRWTRETVIAEIRRLAVDGVGPSHHDARNLHQAAWRLFDGWQRACAAAGVIGRPGSPKPRLIVPSPTTCEDAREILLDALAFCTRHGVHGHGSGDIALRVMQELRGGVVA